MADYTPHIELLSKARAARIAEAQRDAERYRRRVRLERRVSLHCQGD